jgi:hypothetical protein
MNLVSESDKLKIYSDFNYNPVDEEYEESQLEENLRSKQRQKKKNKHHSERAKTRIYYRMFMAEMLGRPLRSDEDVHHKNGNWQDDRPENLEVLLHKEHFRLHHQLNKKIKH